MGSGRSVVAENGIRATATPPTRIAPTASALRRRCPPTQQRESRASRASRARAPAPELQPIHSPHIGNDDHADDHAHDENQDEEDGHHRA